MFYTSFCASVAFLDIRSSSHLHFLMLSIGKLPKLFYAKIATFIEYYFFREETLLNVMKSVTKNMRSIFLTMVFAIILVYLFSIVGFVFFQDDFLIEAVDLNRPVTAEMDYDNEDGSCSADQITCSSRSQLMTSDDDEPEGTKERSCDSLIMCFITVINYGLRNGGGIGDVLRSPSNKEPFFVLRVIYDMLFFFIVIIIVLNLIFGVIIDTFADLRSEKQQKEDLLKNSCFICGT